MNVGTEKKSPVLKVLVDGNGEVVGVENCYGNRLDDVDYHPEEKRRIDQDAVLATENWCRWKLIGGQWK